MKKRYLSLLCSILAVSAHAQTYSHDDPKMKQITVQEIGSGALTPDAYYWALHNSYKKTAAQKNKLSYRTAAGIAAYQQVDDAEKLDSAMVKRAEVEALNVADRTGGALDLAWGVEGSKVTSKLETFETNIRRILQAGGTAVDQRYWQEQAALFMPKLEVGYRRNTSVGEKGRPFQDRHQSHARSLYAQCPAQEAILSHLSGCSFEK